MSTTNNRVRSRQLSFRLTEKELSRWNQKQKASGLNKTEFLLKILDKSDVKIYQFNNTIKAIFHELQMTGNNLNQIAYLSTKRAFRCCSRCTPTHSIYTRIFWSATAICRRENHFVAEEKSFSRCPNISGSSAKPTGLYTQSARIFTALPNAELRLNHR